MTFQAIESSILETIVGGQDASGAGKAAGTAAAPLGATPGAKSPEDRMREIAREEVDYEEKLQEREQFRAWEKSHPFQAMLCGGDISCMR